MQPKFLILVGLALFFLGRNFYIEYNKPKDLPVPNEKSA